MEAISPIDKAIYKNAVAKSILYLIPIKIPIKENVVHDAYTTIDAYTIPLLTIISFIPFSFHTSKLFQ